MICIESIFVKTESCEFWLTLTDMAGLYILRGMRSDGIWIILGHSAGWLCIDIATANRRSHMSL